MTTKSEDVDNPFRDPDTHDGDTLLAQPVRLEVRRPRSREQQVSKDESEGMWKKMGKMLGLNRGARGIHDTPSRPGRRRYSVIV